MDEQRDQAITSSSNQDCMSINKKLDDILKAIGIKKGKSNVKTSSRPRRQQSPVRRFSVTRNSRGSSDGQLSDFEQLFLRPSHVSNSNPEIREDFAVESCNNDAEHREYPGNYIQAMDEVCDTQVKTMPKSEQRLVSDF